jgi:hypothetical protein
MKYLVEMDQLLAGFLKETDEAASLRSGGIISSLNRCGTNVFRMLTGQRGIGDAKSEFSEPGWGRLRRTWQSA